MIWETWKKGFKRWEKTTAEYLEKVLRSSAVLYPSGKLLNMSMEAKGKVDEAAKKWWGSWGLPTKYDQERTLHQLNKLESRLLDMEEELRQIKEAQQSDQVEDAAAE